MNALLTVSTIIHVTSAVVLVGGIFFFRVLLLKYASRTGGLSDELRGVLTGRWLHIAGALLLVLLVTGLINFTFKNEAWKASEGPLSPHMIFGIKFLFFLAAVIVTAVIGMKRKAAAVVRTRLMTVNLCIGLTIVVLSAILSTSY